MQMYHAGPFWPSSQSLLVYWAREETQCSPETQLCSLCRQIGPVVCCWGYSTECPECCGGDGMYCPWFWSTTSAPPLSPGGSVESQPQARPMNPSWWFYLWLIKDKIYFHFKIIFYITTTLHQYVALWNFSIPTSEIHNSTCTLVFPDSKILTLLFFVCSLDLLVILFYGKHHILVRCCVSTHAHHAPLIKPCFLTSAASSLPVPRWRGSVKFQVSFRQ